MVRGYSTGMIAFTIFGLWATLRFAAARSCRINSYLLYHSLLFSQGETNEFQTSAMTNRSDPWPITAGT